MQLRSRPRIEEGARTAVQQRGGLPLRHVWDTGLQQIDRREKALPSADLECVLERGSSDAAREKLLTGQHAALAASQRMTGG